MSEQAKSHGQDYNTKPAGVEKWLDQTSKGLPVQIPENGRTWLADNSWWLALIGGIVSLLGAWGIWQAANVFDYSDLLDSRFGTYTNNIGFALYIGVLALFIQGVLMLMAFQNLKLYKKSGWNLMFYSTFLTVLLSVAYLFIPGYAISSVLSTLVGAVLGWFVLFQIRGKFTK